MIDLASVAEPNALALRVCVLEPNGYKAVAASSGAAAHGVGKLGCAFAGISPVHAMLFINQVTELEKEHAAIRTTNTCLSESVA